MPLLLANKLSEELHEYTAKPSLEELADMLEVVFELSILRSCKLETLVISPWEKYKALRIRLVEAVLTFVKQPSCIRLNEIFRLILMVVQAHGFDPDALMVMREKKFRERGGFKNRIMLRLP